MNTIFMLGRKLTLKQNKVKTKVYIFNTFKFTLGNKGDICQILFWGW